MIGDLPQFPGVLCPAPCNRCTAVVCVGEYYTCSGVCQLYTSCIQVGGQGFRSFPNQEKNLNGDRQRVLLYHTYMASRKPIKSKKPKINDVGGNEQRPDGGGDPLGTKSQSGGFDPLLGYGAVGGVALTAGYIAGKSSGVGARIVNKVKGQTVGTHGSPTPGLKSIDPRISRSDVDVPTVSFMRTDVPPNMRASNVSVNQQYSGRQGSIYVVKADKATSNLPSYKGYVKNQKATVKTNAEGRPMLHFPPTVATKTTTSAKVFAEIPVNKYATEDLLRAEVARQTRLAGGSLRSKSLGDKIKELKPKKKFSRLNPDVS